MRTHALTFGAAIVLATSCTSNDHQETKPRARAASAPSNVTEEPDDVVELLEAGTEPRAELRYRHGQGRSERLIMNLALTSPLEPLQEGDIDEAMVKVALDVGAIAPVGGDALNYPMRLELLSIDMPSAWSSEQRALIQKRLAPLSQVSAVFQLDTRGLTQRTELSLPIGGSPRLLTTIGNVRSALVAAPLPLEPVGVGARWKVERTILMGPIRAQQTVTYTLLQNQDSQLRLGVTLLQVARPQKVAFGQDGTTLDLDTYEVRAVGSSLVNLEKVTPTAELRGGSELHATLHRAGRQDQTMTTGGALLVSVAPATTTP